MASTKKQEKASKKYYDTHKKYREEKIAKSVAKQKANPKKHAEYQKDYYHSNSKYRRYKKEYAEEYRKREKTKSRARKDRKALKER